MGGWVTFRLTCAEEGRRGLCKADGAVRETTRTPAGECLWGRPTVTCADNLQCSKQSCDSVFRVSHSRRFIQRESKNVDADNCVWILTLLFLQNWGGWGAASTSFPEGWCGWRRAGRYVLIHLFGFFYRNRAAPRFSSPRISPGRERRENLPPTSNSFTLSYKKQWRRPETNIWSSVLRFRIM